MAYAAAFYFGVYNNNNKTLVKSTCVNGGSKAIGVQPHLFHAGQSTFQGKSSGNSH